MTFILHSSLGTCKGPQDDRNLFFPQILINSALLDAEYDAHFEFEAKSRRKWSFGRETSDLL